MTNAIDVSDQREEQEALAFFGIRKFNSEKFENSDDDSIMVRQPIDSKGVDAAMTAFHDAFSIEDALPQFEKNRRALLNQ